MPPRIGDVWNVKGYGYPMICVDKGKNGTLVLAPADLIDGEWTAYGMLRLHLSFWGGELLERIHESTAPWE